MPLITPAFLSAAMKDLLWPRCCLACGLKTSASVMCDACRMRSTVVGSPYECETDDRIRPAYALWKFDRQEPIRPVLHRLKYGNCPWIGMHLGGTIADSAPPFLSDEWDVIVPIPLHPKRLLERGYNQAEWIARGLGRVLQVQVAPGALSRRRNTRSQTSFTKEGRTTNVTGAFEANETYNLSGMNVLLVDDTLTTGATLNEAARTLIGTGASTVQPLAVALATLRRDEEQPAAGPVISSRHQSSHYESTLLGHNL